MPNTFAYIALIAWPVVSLFLYRKLPVVPATFWTIVGGYLLLPVKVGIDLPLIPPLDKSSIPAISALIGCKFIIKTHISLLPKEGIERWLIISLLILPFLTVLTNSEPVFDGSAWNKGLSLHDAISSIIRTYLNILPLIIGMQIIKSHDDLLQIYKSLLLAGLFYSLPILFEIRMSPHLHTWTYGFFPHGAGMGWAQQIRFGGFRPVVFMGHGLLVATFIVICFGASLILWKNKVKTFGISPVIFIIYLLVILVLCKTVGAYFLGLILLISISWLPTALVKRLSKTIILFVVLYPLISMLDIFPHQELIDFIAKFDMDRSESLSFRFYHENRILQHTHEKFLFGWGGWGRNLFFDSVPDGYWVIILSLSGIVGFVSIFGLSLLVIFKSTKASSLIVNENEKSLVIFTAIIVAIIMLDQLPNNSLYSWLWLLIGSLSGRTNSILNSR